MRHDFAGFEQAVFWLHVVMAVLLAGYLLHGKELAISEWVTFEQQTPTNALFSDALLPESATPQPSGKSAARAPHVTVTNASFSESKTCR